MNEDKKISIDEILKRTLEQQAREIFRVDYYKKLAAAELKKLKSESLYKEIPELSEGYSDIAVENKFNLIYQTINKIIEETFSYEKYYPAWKYCAYRNLEDKVSQVLRNFEILFDTQKFPRIYEDMIREWFKDKFKFRVNLFLPLISEINQFDNKRGIQTKIVILIREFEKVEKENIELFLLENPGYGYESKKLYDFISKKIKHKSGKGENLNLSEAHKSYLKKFSR